MQTQPDSNPLSNNSSRPTRRAGSRTGRALAVLAVASTLPACYQVPPLEIAHQSAPDPLMGVRTYLFAPISFNNFTYDGRPEPMWQATRSPRQQESWAHDKAESTSYAVRQLASQLHRGEQIEPLMGAAAPGQFVMAINVDAFEHGGCHATLRIQNAAGQVVDEVGIPPLRVGGFFGGFAIAFRVCLNNASTRSLEYIRTRY